MSSVPPVENPVPPPLPVGGPVPMPEPSVPLDPDLMTLWKQSGVISHHTDILRIHAMRENSKAMNRNVESMLGSAGTAKDALIEQLYVSMVETYMRPNITSVDQTVESMQKEAARDAARLQIAVEHVMAAIVSTKLKP